jgi:hypothetical protein
MFTLSPRFAGTAAQALAFVPCQILASAVQSIGTLFFGSGEKFAFARLAVSH